MRTTGRNGAASPATVIGRTDSGSSLRQRIVARTAGLTQRGNRIFAGLLALSLLSCGSKPSLVTVDNRLDVEIHIAPAPDELPFNPRAARLLAANHQLSSLLGHGLEFDIDAALVAEWKSDFEQQLVETIESLLRLLTELRQTDTSEFALTAQSLKKVECRYSVLVEYAETTFKNGTLLIELPAHPRRLIAYDMALRAFHDYHVSSLDTRFAKTEPETVTVADMADYFHWLSQNGYGYRWEARHRPKHPLDGAEKIANDPEGDVIARIVRLYSRIEANNPALSSEVRGWLLARIGWLTELYLSSDTVPLPSPVSNTAMRRGERALCGWLERALPKASDEERLGANKALFPRSGPYVCANVDRLAFGLREADAWLKTGKPVEHAESAKAKLIDAIVCPSLRGPDGQPVRSMGCESGWLHFVLGDDPSRRRLAAALDTRDPELTWQLYATLKYRPPEGAVALARLLNAHKPALSAALVTFAEIFTRQQPEGAETLLDDLWRTQPERRGDILYAFAREKYETFWERFKAEYNHITEVDFASFLDHGASAFEFTLKIWPAFDKGVSRARPIVNHLASLVPDASQPSASSALRTLAKVVSRLCAEQANGDLAGLHTALEARAVARPGERKALTMLLRDTAIGGCTASKKDDSRNEP